jgi:ribosomal-protein-alanine N-acetyltransferase
VTADDDAPRLFTRRLELIAATPELARADADDPAQLGQQLQAEVPPGWPPERYTHHQRSFAERLGAQPSLTGWLMWYAVQIDPAVLVGAVGLSGPPDGDGAVELIYFMLDRFQRKGYATEAVGALIDWAFSNEVVRCIRAITSRSLPPAAVSVLERNGLSFVGEGNDPGTMRFELARK